MAFGFPASHTEVVPAPGHDGDPLAPFRGALDSLGWPIKDDTEDRIHASTSVNLRSWGERLVIELQRGDSIKVTSRCALPTQCVDWGRNKANVQKLLEHVRNVERGVSG